MRFLIVNADDLGISPGINRGIVATHTGGVVSSTSLMANLPAFDDAVSRLADCPNLDVGVHLNLTCGSPVLQASRRSSLTDASGNLRQMPGLLARVTARIIRRSDIEHELGAQVERVLSRGINVSHLDTHQNVHLHPVIRKGVMSVASAFDIKWVRFSHQPPVFVPGAGAAGAQLPERLKLILVKAVCFWPSRLFARSAPVSRRILGAPILLRCSLREMFVAAIQSAASAVTELVCHPGHVDDELRAIDSYLSHREEEMTTLKDPALKELLERNSVRLTTYRALAEIGLSASALCQESRG